MNDSGKRGEHAAETYLKLKGYEIADKNFSCRFGEIDIIARKQQYIVFCEVKTRSKGSLVGAIESVGPKKVARIIKTAEWYIQKFGCFDLQPRFDVIAVEKRGPLYFVTQHIEDAFS